MNLHRFAIPCVFFLFQSGASLGKGLPQVPFRGDLRLRLQDPVQESRTSSIDGLSKVRIDPPPVKLASLGKPQAQSALPPLTNAHGGTRVPRRRPFKVVLDPGHGGHEWGAPGHFGLMEKTISLRSAFLLRREIERNAKLLDLPVVVRLTRTDDVFLSLKDRVALANQEHADILVSLHANSAPSRTLRGFEVYFSSNEATDDHSTRVAHLENQLTPGTRLDNTVLGMLKDAQASLQIQQSSELASKVYQSMSRALRSNIRGVRQAPFTVLAGAEMPALLIEIGYLSHEGDAQLLSKPAYLKKAAQSISQGIFAYIVDKNSRNRASLTSVH